MHLLQVRRVGSFRTRERCLTFSPMCASPSTPSPTARRIEAVVGLVKEWVPLRLTAMIVGFMGLFMGLMGFEVTPRARGQAGIP